VFFQGFDVLNVKISSSPLIFGLAIMLSGCAEYSLKVLPNIGELTKKTVCITCKVEYDGNREYLPSYLDNNASSTTTASYSYDVKYVNGSTDWDGLNLFNPLLIVGFPLSEESVIVQGVLKIQDGLSEPHIYTSSCIANKTRSLYQNSGSSAPRKACLYAVRDNINSQLIQYKQEEKK
jgi:hypothetical protein